MSLRIPCLPRAALAGGDGHFGGKGYWPVVHGFGKAEELAAFAARVNHKGTLRNAKYADDTTASRVNGRAGANASFERMLVQRWLDARPPEGSSWLGYMKPAVWGSNRASCAHARARPRHAALSLEHSSCASCSWTAGSSTSA